MSLRRFIAPLLTLILLLLTLVPAQAQTSFTLGLPNERTIKRDLALDLPSFNWTPLAAATEYNLWVFHISGNPRFGTILDVAVPTSNCVGSACTYVLDNDDWALFETGEYSWTVEAITTGDTVEAANGPRYFSYDPSAVQFVVNGGFENGKSTPWKTSNISSDRVLVDPAHSFTGNASWLFKGKVGENSILAQTYDVSYYNINAADVLTLAFAYKTSGSGLKGFVRVNVTYTDGTKIKEQKSLSTPSASYLQVTEVIELTKPVKTLKITLNNQSSKTTSKIYIDAVTLTLSDTTLRATALPFPTK